MKKLALTVALLLAMFGAGAQEKAKTTAREGNTFCEVKTTTSKSDILTIYKWKDAKGNEYPIWLSKNCAVYVVRTSAKTGKEYRQYLDREIAKEICREMGIEYVEPKKEGAIK